MKLYRDTVREATLLFIEDFIMDVAHDIYHLDRVCNNALLINELENNNRDNEIIILSAYLHDFHRLYRTNSKESKLKKVEESNHLISEFFTHNKVFNIYTEKVISVISQTDKYSFSDKDKSKSDLISKIIYDADNLEALGAIGISRAFAFGQWINEPIYNPSIPLNTGTFSHTEKTHSVLHHFFEKILKLESEFYTETGKKMAKIRTDFTKKYIDTFLEEIV